MQKGEFVMMKVTSSETHISGVTYERAHWVACVVASATRQLRVKKLAKLDDSRAWQYIEGAPMKAAMGKPPLFDPLPFSLTPFPAIRALDAWNACLARRYPGAVFDTAEEAKEFVASLPRIA